MGFSKFLTCLLKMPSHSSLVNPQTSLDLLAFYRKHTVHAQLSRDYHGIHARVTNFHAAHLGVIKVGSLPCP